MGPLLSFRAPRLPLFAPDNTARIAPPPPLQINQKLRDNTSVQSRSIHQRFHGRWPHKNILTPLPANNVHHQHQRPTPQ